MEIEFSKNGEGKILLGISCIKTDENKYQKILTLDSVKDDITCKSGDILHRDDVKENLATLVFNRDESIELLIDKLTQLKSVDVVKLFDKADKCDDSTCVCRLSDGC